MRPTMNTPAATMVAAWIRAETGVGPAMASGSQVCKGTWADLLIAPQKIRMPESVRIEWLLRLLKARSLAGGKFPEAKVSNRSW